MIEPELLQLVLEVDLLADVAEEAVIPLLDGEVLTESGEIEDDHRDIFPPETGSGVDHEGGLAHLAAGEHVAELAVRQALEQLLVGLALDVGGRVPLEGTARDIEARGCCAHWHAHSQAGNSSVSGDLESVTRNSPPSGARPTSSPDNDYPLP